MSIFKKAPEKREKKFSHLKQNIGLCRGWGIIQTEQNFTLLLLMCLSPSDVMEVPLFGKSETGSAGEARSYFLDNSVPWSAPSS